MFFELVSRNSKRSRKENGLFFASLLISIVAFYNILALSKQDIMIFLAKLESDAVNKLLAMIYFAGNAPFKIILYVTGGRFPQQYSNGAPCGAWYYRTSNFNFFSGNLMDSCWILPY